jgi:hypothetical protein
VPLLFFLGALRSGQNLVDSSVFNGPLQIQLEVTVGITGDFLDGLAAVLRYDIALQEQSQRNADSCLRCLLRKTRSLGGIGLLILAHALVAASNPQRTHDCLRQKAHSDETDGHASWALCRIRLCPFDTDFVSPLSLTESFPTSED